MERRHAYSGSAVFIAGAALLAGGFWLGRASRPEEDSARPTPQPGFVVQELSWRFRARGLPLVLDDGRPGKPVRAFAERGRAAAHCRQLNLRRRATENPFRYMPEATGGSFFDQYTTRGAAAFPALVRAEGLTPPAHAGEDELASVWADWWDEHRQEWDDRLVGRLWDALDRLSFYEVVEVPADP